MEEKQSFNEIMTILNFLDKMSRAYEVSSDSKGFYKALFASDVTIDSIALIKFKLDYINIIDRAIKKIQPSKGNKSTDTLYKIQSIISELSINYDIFTIRDVVNNLLSYKEKLELIEELYADKFTEVVVDNEKLHELKTQLQDLIDYLKEIEIDNTFKTLIMDNLLSIQYYINKYDICGIEGIRNELNRLAGSLLMNLGNPQNPTENEKSLFNRILDFIKKGNDIIKFGENMYTLGQAAPAIFALVDKVIK